MSRKAEIERRLEGDGITPRSVGWFEDEEIWRTPKRPAFDRLRKAILRELEPRTAGDPDGFGMLPKRPHRVAVVFLAERRDGPGQGSLGLPAEIPGELFPGLKPGESAVVDGASAEGLDCIGFGLRLPVIANRPPVLICSFPRILNSCSQQGK